MEEIQDYLEKTIDKEVCFEPYTEMYRITSALYSNYEFFVTVIDGMHYLMAVAHATYSLSMLLRQIEQIDELTGMRSVICLHYSTNYACKKMKDEYIPHVILGKQILIPGAFSSLDR